MWESERGDVLGGAESGPIDGSAGLVPGREKDDEGFKRSFRELRVGVRSIELFRLCSTRRFVGEEEPSVVRGWPKTKPLAAAAMAVPAPMSCRGRGRVSKTKPAIEAADCYPKQGFQSRRVPVGRMAIVTKNWYAISPPKRVLRMGWLCWRAGWC